MQARPVNREFVPRGDPLGTPIQYGSKASPVVPPSAGAPQIPRLRGKRNLVELKKLLTLSRGDAFEKANALIKAARIYQKAVWVCDADPALTCMLLISAIETAAVV